MSKLLVIRLHPNKSVSAADFQLYLADLSIEANELSVEQPTDGNSIGTARYLDPYFPSSSQIIDDIPVGISTEPDTETAYSILSPVPEPEINITQHFRLNHTSVPLSSSSEWTREMLSVGTAVIEIPDPASEYDSVDIRLVISRGDSEIIHKQKYYNVPLSNGPLPVKPDMSTPPDEVADPRRFQELTDVSLLLELPTPESLQKATLTVPEDGTAPNFAQLKEAVHTVLADDLGGDQLAEDKIKELTLQEARHIAYEILWGKTEATMPEYDRFFLERIYTDPDNDGEPNDRQDRQKFEGELLSYYVRNNNEADRLTSYVYALSAAIWCEKQSTEANKAGLIFPVLLDDPKRRSKVILKGVGSNPLNPAFTVPAEYFYALSSTLPPQINRQQRFDMAMTASEEQIIVAAEQAIEDRVFDAYPDDEDSKQINPSQAARRLQALGLVKDKGTPECEVIAGSAVQTLVTAWLNFAESDINNFWTASPDEQGHLALVLCAVTQSYEPLVQAIKQDSATVEIEEEEWQWIAVNSVTALKERAVADWKNLFDTSPALLPPFTAPGTTEERIRAFLRHLRRFFDATNLIGSPDPAVAPGVPTLERPSENLVDALLEKYPGFTFEHWDDEELNNALEAIFPNNHQMQEQFTEWLDCIHSVIRLTAGIAPEALRFSVIEALWARGFLKPGDLEGLSAEDFQDALVGSVAYEFAEQIWNNADPGAGEPEDTGVFTPVNPDGRLVNCIPPEHLSPLGPVAYLQELLKVPVTLTCEEFSERRGKTIEILLQMRHRSFGDLLASEANLSVPLPLIDLANEALEYIAAPEDGVSRIIYNTAEDQVGNHELTSNKAPSEDAFLHDPATLLEALPEHSTPNTPAERQGAWEKIKNDFSACNLPYHQPFDIARTYLEQLGTSRYATMRRFRKEITEFVLAPTNEPDDFQRHLWRYPVRHELALEYLGISLEEYNMLYSSDIEQATLLILYGFSPDENRSWQKIIIRLPEFLKRTCLTYCEFRELWQSNFVPFSLRKSTQEGQLKELPECEPCCLSDYYLDFDEDTQTEDLKQLAVFIRLWRKLQGSPKTAYSFAELAEIAETLQLFKGTTVNADFIRQLAALQMLRDDFQLSLNVIDILAFWGTDDSKKEKAVQHLLDQIQQYAQGRYGCRCRPPEFIKILKDNLDPLSVLAGFHPHISNTPPPDPDYAWDARPTHTLRFAEILAKIYASDFQVGELLFLFTADPQLQGGDPYPLQTENEALDLPFGLPDDEAEHSLFTLRKTLLEILPDKDAAAQWSWRRMGEVLRREFGLEDEEGKKRWLSFGKHFFPDILTAEGIALQAHESVYSTDLSGTSEAMWNTPLDGPFQYDTGDQKLWTQVPLTDEAVIDKLSRIRQLNGDEIHAVQELYFMPRAELVFFSFLFENQLEAEQRLIQEPDAAGRWAWFQSAFERFYRRCHAIAEHFAAHLDAVTGDPKADGKAMAMLLLKHLRADENRSVSGDWENDSGEVPAETWGPAPNGGAFAALLGLVGTGMQVDYTDEVGTTRWREMRGGIETFGSPENACNAPVPTIIPAMDFLFTDDSQLHYAAVRNGFAMANDDGRPLGGAESFRFSWHGLLLIEQTGKYGFSAGAPTAASELPDFEAICSSHRWRVTLQQGQKTWVLLSHHWPAEEAPSACCKPIMLEHGFYELNIELERLPMQFDGPEDVFPRTTGFQLKYDGPDADNTWQVIPDDKLFIPKKDASLGSGLEFSSSEINTYLRNHYVSTVRDMRRTYQRVFKAMLFVDRLSLSTSPVADDGQSEIAYLLSKAEKFLGQSYYRDNGGFAPHKAHFNFNFLPVLDEYFRPDGGSDRRSYPSEKRCQALFDWWERLFDYTVMRAATSRSPEMPVWLLFHEAAEGHTDKPAHLLRHMGVDVRHNDLVLQAYDSAEADLSYDVTSSDLEDERWAIRVWRADLWCKQLNTDFFCKDIREVAPYLWVSDKPEEEVTLSEDKKLTGLANLTKFYRDGCIENGEPRRYKEIKQLNDGLRERGRAALIAYLIHMNRVSMPWGGFAETAQHLSELLLLDIEAGLSQKASRIEEAVTAVQLYINRARLGLEYFTPAENFVFAWERRFSSFREWQACKRREIYRENWIEWDETEKARKTEAYQFLESELRRSDLTLPLPGGLPYWPDPELPAHTGLTLLQEREPATQQVVTSQPQGLNLLGTPDRHARTSWLAPTRIIHIDNNDSSGNATVLSATDSNEQPLVVHPAGTGGMENNYPMWLQAAVRLGTKFLRIAAAGTPPASTAYVPQCELPEPTSCCEICGETHPALIDEYYFWIEEAEYHEPKEQVAEWGTATDAANPLSDWHRPDKLPGLLHWETKTIIHLHWCRVHNGEFQTLRRSGEGVQLVEELEDGQPKLQFNGREGDSLNFTVIGGTVPEGYSPPPEAGFRYDLAVDSAVTLPEFPDGVTASETEEESETTGGLPSFPYFAWHSPGAPLLPIDRFSSVIAVATHLAMHCRFEESLNWLKSIYDPLESDNTWMNCDEEEGEACCCPSEPVSDQGAKQRLAMMLFVETLLDWTDALLRKNTAEAFQRARLLADTAGRILGAAPATIHDTGEDTPQLSVADMKPACAPLNPRLMCLYTKTQDRLDQIHASINSRRITNDDPMPYWGNDSTRECWKQNRDICLEEAFQCRPASPYRFQVLVQKAIELANEVKSLGGQLLAAYEKGDAEYLSQIRVMHERQLNELTLEIRQNQWRESDWQVQALEKSKEITLTRLQYYKNLIAVGLISGEAEYEARITSSTALRATGNIVESIGQTMNLIPDPNVGFPCNFVTLPVGKKLAMIFAAAGRVVNTVSDIISASANLGLTKAGWERREQEWQHQVDVLTIEVEQIERQILAAERRRDISLRELNNHRQLMRNTAELHDFLRDKFTSHALYLWLQKETAALYHRMYELALHTAFQAESAFNYERGLTDRFIPKEIWDNLHEGLLSGERLALALRQMDKAYLDRNVREYELSKHFSLRQYFPTAFLQLRYTGYCEIEVPEWLFDLDYPGQYFRRIKNVSVSIPCVAGPYSGIHCRLTLLDSTTRISPELLKPVRLCCDDESCNNGYPSVREDKRLIKNYTATEAIATSGGQNDSGMFELNFRDERYLPFEYCGAVSRWRIELPLENNRFDMESLSDFIVHLNYTAREGGDNLRVAARECAQNTLPDKRIRFLDVKRDLGGVPVKSAGSHDDALRIGLKISRTMFPYLTSNQGLVIKGFDILFEARDARPSTHNTLTFFAGQSIDRFNKSGRCRKNVHSIDCVGDAEWPGFYHGVLELNLGEIGPDGQLDLGVMQFSDEVEDVDNIYLLIRYEVVKWSKKTDGVSCCGY